MLSELKPEDKIVIYTVIMGDYDYLKDPEYITENCDYICYTNNPEIKSSVWQIRFDKCENLDNTRWQRKHKIMAHEYLPEYKASVYVDGNVRILGDFREYISKYGTDSTILCLKHPDRDCIYDEAEACINMKKDNAEVISSQMERYRNEGYPEHNGLIVSNVLVREHTNAEVIKLMNSGWNEIETGSRRDQLSFNYVCFKNNFTYDVSDLKCWRSKYWSNPGIHTRDIKAVEEELINHIQQEDYYCYQIRQKDEYIKLKEQELKDAQTYIGWKEQELKDAQTYISWKEQELKDANTQLEWKEQSIGDLKNRYNRTITRRVKRLFKKKSDSDKK